MGNLSTAVASSWLFGRPEYQNWTGRRVVGGIPSDG